MEDKGQTIQSARRVTKWTPPQATIPGLRDGSIRVVNVEPA